jgi:hypothetical protein
MPATITLGKDATITGVSNARSVTVTNSAAEVDVTTLADGAAGFRKYKKALIEQTVEVECVDAPGVSIGGTFTLAGTETGDATYIVTNVAKSEPIDGIVTFTVSGSRSDDQT